VAHSRAEGGGKVNWKENQNIVVDLETTGRYPTQEAIDRDRRAPMDAVPAVPIQIGTSLKRSETENRAGHGRPFESGEVWINPGCEVPRDVVEAIGLTDAELAAIRDAKPFSHFAKMLHWSLSTRRVVIGYNILAYDQPILTRMFRLAGLDWPQPAWTVDAMVLAQHLLVDAGLPDYKLATVAEYFRIDAGGAHRAAADCVMTRGILDALAPQLPDDLGALLNWQNARADLGHFWALRMDGSLGLNCQSRQNPELRRGMSPSEVRECDPGFYRWAGKMIPFEMRRKYGL
jgi:DNA polymerase III epsilon subunit-like protein